MTDSQRAAADKIQNPFPGPQPYRAESRHLFFGRDALVKTLANQILAYPLTTLYGPSGAGKSSLMQAGVIPRLEETHDFRTARVDTWPPGKEPLLWFVRALFTDLELGRPSLDKSAMELLDEALGLAERRSDQPILIYLDQLEQLLFPERPEAQAEELLEGIDRLANAPIQGLHIVLSLREDYLGRFRDRARDRPELLEHGFRLGPLTVGEIVNAVCRAAFSGRPRQRWGEEQIQSLMLDVRTPGESPSDSAEVQAAYAQIVCRALFQELAQGRAPGVIAAEPILHRYLEATLADLGELRADARRLLEDHLVTKDGTRTLRTEGELRRIFSAETLKPILQVLEAAAILHAEAHQGSRYFEIGHDWLAKRVAESRHQRESALENARRHEERRREIATLDRLRRRLTLAILASVVSLGCAAFIGGLAWLRREAARRESGCPDGELRCEGNAPRLCVGGQWQIVDACVGKTCVDGRCVGECAVSAKRCADNTPQICGPDGAWKREPSCEAPRHCQGGACVISCEPLVDVACFGNTPQTCDASGAYHPGEPCKSSTCIEGSCKGECALGDARCSMATPYTPEICDATGHWKEQVSPCVGMCVAGSCPGPSCTILPETCGPEKNESCGLSPVVLGGQYNRSDDPAAPATVSDFRLDRFEVTVGRFRKFVEAYPGSKPGAGAGAHPLIAETGWDPSWSSNLPQTQAALQTSLKCNRSVQTWTDEAGANENMPINCVNWYEAFAFCAWDRGRLPTEAEWNYAAAGGAEQRIYPWSSPPGSSEIDGTFLVYNCEGAGEPDGCVFSDIGFVGSRSKKGDGKWGQADMAGNMWEWVFDGIAPYESHCNNCANTKLMPRVVRGGSWGYDFASYVRSSSRYGYFPSDRSDLLGLRCARTL